MLENYCKGIKEIKVFDLNNGACQTLFINKIENVVCIVKFTTREFQLVTENIYQLHGNVNGKYISEYY